MNRMRCCWILDEILQMWVGFIKGKYKKIAAAKYLINIGNYNDNDNIILLTYNFNNTFSFYSTFYYASRKMSCVGFVHIYRTKRTLGTCWMIGGSIRSNIQTGFCPWWMFKKCLRKYNLNEKFSSISLAVLYALQCDHLNAGVFKIVIYIFFWRWVEGQMSCCGITNKYWQQWRSNCGSFSSCDVQTLACGWLGCIFDSWMMSTLSMHARMAVRKASTKYWLWND